MRSTLLPSLLISLSASLGAADTAPAPTPTAVTLHGTVWDESGDAPIANLTIFADSAGTRLTTTDDRGRFEVTVDPAKGLVQLLPYRDDIVGKSFFVDPLEFRDKPIRLVMERGLKFIVTVRDEAGKPVIHAKVDWYNSGGAHGFTGDDGVAAIGMVPRFRDGSVSVLAEGYLPYHRDNIQAILYRDDGIVVTLKSDPKAPPKPPEAKKPAPAEAKKSDF